MARNNQNGFAAEPDQERLYRAHKLMKSNPKEALFELKALAELNSTMSMIYLGEAYKFGNGVASDLAEAESWYRRAANAGALPAYYLLGRLYLNMKRYTEAKDAFRYAADRDYMPAIHFMGRIYFYGRGVAPNLMQAQAYLERASAHGCVFAKRKLATLLMQKGRGLGERLRGVWLLVASFFDLLVVICTQGTSSIRLR